MRKCQFTLLPLFVFALASANANLSVVALDTGEQVIGDILTQSSTIAVIIRSPLLGEVKVPRARVVSIRAKDSKPALIKSSSSAEGKHKKAEESAINEETLLETLLDLKAPGYWSGNMRLGINLSQGDRKWQETYAKGKLEIDPKQSPNFYRLSGSYTYRQSERANGDAYKSTDKYNAEFTYRRSFFENWFTQNALGYRADRVKGIDREVQVSAGIGYQYKPSNRFKFLLGGGVGVEKLDAKFGDSRADSSPFTNIFQEATWRPFKRTSVVQQFSYYWNPKDSNQFNYVLTAAVRVRFTELLGFEFSYNKSFDNDLGNSKAKDDTQWRNALVFYF
jgi:putative salt-induced outer membrane protein YdiY